MLQDFHLLTLLYTRRYISFAVFSFSDMHLATTYKHQFQKHLSKFGKDSRREVVLNLNKISNPDAPWLRNLLLQPFWSIFFLHPFIYKPSTKVIKYERGFPQASKWTRTIGETRGSLNLTIKCKSWSYFKSLYGQNADIISKGFRFVLFKLWVMLQNRLRSSICIIKGKMLELYKWNTQPRQLLKTTYISNWHKCFTGYIHKHDRA